MSKEFYDAVRDVLGAEGGYVNEKTDLGGETNMGIATNFVTASDIKKVLGKQVEIEDLTRKQVIQIYKELYWEPYHCELLDNAFGAAFFDMSINQGKPVLALRAAGLGNKQWPDIADEYKKIYLKDPSICYGSQGFLNEMSATKIYIGAEYKGKSLAIRNAAMRKAIAAKIEELGPEKFWDQHASKAFSQLYKKPSQLWVPQMAKAVNDKYRENPSEFLFRFHAHRLLDYNEKTNKSTYLNGWTKRALGEHLKSIKKHGEKVDLMSVNVDRVDNALHQELYEMVNPGEVIPWPIDTVIFECAYHDANREFYKALDLDEKFDYKKSYFEQMKDQEPKKYDKVLKAMTSSAHSRLKEGMQYNRRHKISLEDMGKKLKDNYSLQTQVTTNIMAKMARDLSGKPHFTNLEFYGYVKRCLDMQVIVSRHFNPQNDPKTKDNQSKLVDAVSKIIEAANPEKPVAAETDAVKADDAKVEEKTDEIETFLIKKSTTDNQEDKSVEPFSSGGRFWTKAAALTAILAYGKKFMAPVIRKVSEKGVGSLAGRLGGIFFKRSLPIVGVLWGTHSLMKAETTGDRWKSLAQIALSAAPLITLIPGVNVAFGVVAVCATVASLAVECIPVNKNKDASTQLASKPLSGIFGNSKENVKGREMDTDSTDFSQTAAMWEKNQLKDNPALVDKEIALISPDRDGRA